MKRFPWVLLPVILFAFALRVIDLANPDLGMDGGWSTALSALPLPDLLRISSLDVHPPLYYFLLNIWQDFAGRTPFALKYISLFASTASIPLFYLLARRVFGRSNGIFAGLLLAVAPVHVISVGIIRDISLGLFFNLLSSCLFLRSIDKESIPFKAMALYSLATLAALYTTYFSVPILVAQGIVVVLSNSARHTIRAWLASWIVPGFAFLPWLLFFLPSLWEKLSTGQSARQANMPTLSLTDFIGGMAHQLTSNEFGQLPSLLPEGAFLSVLLGASFLAFLQSRSKMAGSYQFYRSSPKLFIITSLCLLIALTYLLTRSWVGEGVPYRYALMSLPFFLLIVSASLDKLQKVLAPLSYLLLGCLIFIGLLTLNGYRDRPTMSLAQWDPVGMTRFLDANAGHGDGIVFTTLEQAGYYHALSKSPLQWYYVISGLGFMEDTASPKPEEVLPPALQNHRVLWLMAYQGSDSDVTKSARNWLDEKAYPASSQWLSDTLVLAYVSAQEPGKVIPANIKFGNMIELEGYTISNLSNPGEGLAVSLKWRALTKIDKDYKVFVHLLDSKGQTIANHDSPPQNGLSPTSTWKEGQEVDDHHGLLLGGHLPEGSQIEVGLYTDEGRLTLPNGEGKYTLNLPYP